MPTYLPIQLKDELAYVFAKHGLDVTISDVLLPNSSELSVYVRSDDTRLVLDNFVPVVEVAKNETKEEASAGLEPRAVDEDETPDRGSDPDDGANSTGFASYG